jgi:hypothetical protein
MKLPITHAHGLAAFGLWALTAVAAAAGPNLRPSDPADDRAPVPATRYQPLVTTSPSAAPASSPASSPADNWKALNREVASFDSMSLTMEMQGAASAKPGAHEELEQHKQHKQHEPEAAIVPMPASAAQPPVHKHHITEQK